MNDVGKMNHNWIGSFLAASVFMLVLKGFCDDTPLHEAAEFGNVELVTSLLASNADVNAHGINGWTPLHRVVMVGNTNMAALLIKHKADVNARGDNGETPIYRAIGSAGMIKLLLANGADINAEDKWHNTVLSGAVGGALNIGADIIPLLLTNGANAVVLGLDGETPLYQAVLEKNKTIIDELLPYYTNSEGKKRMVTSLALAMDERSSDLAQIIFTSAVRLETNLLHRAAIGGDVQAARSLLARHPDSINDQGILGWTPLHLAAQSGQTEVAELLLNHANLDLQDALGNTPLHWAAYFGHGKVVELLLRHKAKVELKDTIGNRPLDFAVQENFLPIAEMLVTNGANLNEAGKWYGQFPLHIAVRNGNVEGVRLLLRHGANVNSVEINSATPLDFAIMGDSPEIVQLLLTNGAGVKTRRGGKSWNMFHFWALGAGNPSIADRLLVEGCDPLAKNSDGQTPLHLAVHQGQQRAVQWLLDHKADINAKDAHGKTPLSLIVIERWGRKLELRPEIVKLLIERGAKE